MGQRDVRTGRDSRVCKPWDAPYTWVDYLDPSEPGFSEMEAWLCGLEIFVQLDIEGRLDDLFAAAAAGELEDSGDETTPIKPIHLDPEIFELRSTQLTKKLRFYHGEPDFMPSALVLTHQHIKTTNEAQAAEIRVAVTRYRRGRSSRWT